MILSLLHIKLIFSKGLFYNSIVLENKLEIENAKYSHDELLCLAYRKWGTLLFPHLEGDFAFSFYDADEKSYFAARDPLGVKALYFTKIEENYHFASSISELLNLPNIQKKPNLKSMKTMLYSRTVEYSNTLYEGIYRLPPGHFMTIENGKAKIERYWFPEKIKRDYKITEEEAVKKLHNLFLNAINKRVLDLEETAVEVSGGIDSSSVACLLAKNRTASKIDSYSMELKGLKCDEDVYVDSLLEQYPLNHQKISCEKLDYTQKYSLTQLYTVSADWPLMHVSAIGYFMAEKMYTEKKRVILTGQGGDEVFGWNSYIFYDLFMRFKFLTLYRELKYLAKPWRAIKKYIVKPVLGERGIRFLKIIFRKKKKNNFFKKSDEVKSISQIAKIKDLSFIEDIDSITSARHVTVMDGNFLHPMEEYFSVEFRHPFYDLELVEFSLSLPPKFKLSKGRGKYIFRKAMENILPEKINSRTDKAEFSEILEQQIDALDLSALLNNAYIVKLGLIDQAGIYKIRNEYEAQSIKKPFHIWGLINMEYCKESA